jgi:siroheme synthase (precorrin-2 oxidase/ferrochelatase)
LGLEVWRVDDETLPSGYRLVLIGTESLSPRHADRLRRRVEELKPGLKMILSSNWQEDLLAIRGEGAA